MSSTIPHADGQPYKASSQISISSHDSNRRREGFSTATTRLPVRLAFLVPIRPKGMQPQTRFSTAVLFLEMSRNFLGTRDKSFGPDTGCSHTSNSRQALAAVCSTHLKGCEEPEKIMGYLASITYRIDALLARR